MVSTVKRRRFVQAMSGGLAVSIAGCSTDAQDEDPENDSDDEQTQENGEDTETVTGSNGGVAYAFGPNTIAIIDPAEGEVVDEITEGIDGYEWGDAVPTSDGSQLFHRFL